MIRKTVLGPRLLCSMAVLLFLGACALPHDPARQAVDSVREQKQEIPYNQDVKTAGNTSLFGFRSLPKRAEAPAVSVAANRSVAEVSQCLQGQIKTRFKLPEDFFQVKNYANNSQSVALVNPFTKKEGLMLDVVPSGVNGSTIKLYANGATLSKAWQQMPARCGGSQATLVSKAETPAKAAAAPRTRRSADAATAETTTRSQRRSSASASSKTPAAKTDKTAAGGKTAKGKKVAPEPQTKQSASKKTTATDKKSKDNQGKGGKTQSKNAQSKDPKGKDNKTKENKTKGNKAKTQDKNGKAAAKNSNSKPTGSAGKSSKKEGAAVKPKPQQKKAKS